MCCILDRYVANRELFRLPMLDDMMRLELGGAGGEEGVGLTNYGILVIDTDGIVRKNDTPKSAAPGDTFDGHWSVHIHSLADIAATPEFRAYHLAQRSSFAIP